MSWRRLAPGLEHAQTHFVSAIGDGQLHVVRVELAHYRLVLLTGAATNAAPRTARQWAGEHQLVAAINAGMFRANGLPVGYAKAEGRVIQPTLSQDRSVLVFNTTSASLLDLACDGFDADKEPNALQCIRMVAYDGRNVWGQQNRRWSMTSLAQDVSGNILFLHARSPLSVHDFINMIKTLPLGIARATYLEGGPEATLFAKATGGEEIERIGSYETGFNENDGNAAPWPLPNILGVALR